jgi:hypothetical protein
MSPWSNSNIALISWESGWRKVKIEGSRKKFPSGVFRRCNRNLGNEKGARYDTRGATSWFTKPRPSVKLPALLDVRSPGPKGSSTQLPTPPGIALSEPSQEWPLVDTPPVREALFNTLRKDVHRGQKDSVIGTY